MDEPDLAPMNLDMRAKEIKPDIPEVSVQSDTELPPEYDALPPDYKSLDMDHDAPLICGTDDEKVTVVVDRGKYESTDANDENMEDETERNGSTLKLPVEDTIIASESPSLLRNREIKRTVSLRSMDAGNRMSRDVHREQMFLGAVADMNMKVAEDFISSGVDVNCRSQYKRQTAIHELVKSFFAQYLDVDYEKLKAKFVDMLSNLIHLGLIINSTDSSHRTALHLAAGYPDSSEIITVLMSSGLDSNIPDDTQQTALHKAVCKATVDDVRALIEGGANLHVLDAVGNAPIHLAAKRRELSHWINTVGLH